MRDKITTDILKAVKLIEQQEVTFIKRKEKLLEKYKEIYTPHTYSYDDLINRKIYLQNSRANYLSVYLTVVLAVLSTFLFNTISYACSFSFSWIPTIVNVETTKTLIYITSQLVTLILCVMLAVLVSHRISNILDSGDKNFKRYNTNKFEIEIINCILEEQFKLDEVKKEITEGYFSNHASKNVRINEGCTDET